MARQLLYVANGRALMRERVFRDRSNPLETHDDKAMHKYYRFTRQGIMNIIDLLEPHLQPSTTRSHAIDGRLQIFIALNYYATSDFYSSVRKEHGISISSVCRIVHRVSEVLVELKDEILTFGEKEQKQNEFFALSRFPRVVGAVDGTHVWLDSSPLGELEHIYVNRKGYHSINVQFIVDASFKIINVVARWPGSTHDARILENSEVGRMFERGDLQGVLVGDSGYPQKPWLMTPFRNPRNRAQLSYNR